MANGQIEAVRKITVKEILKGKPEKVEVDLGAEGKVQRVKDQDLMVIIGRARAHDTRSSEYGPFTEYMGNFEGRRMKDGTVFQSTRMILPPPASDVFFNHYMDAKGEDAEAVVECAFVIGVEYSPRGTEGYRFTCRPIVDPRKDTRDPLDDLRRMLGEQLPEIADKLGLPQPTAQITKQETATAATEEPAKASKTKAPA